MIACLAGGPSASPQKDDGASVPQKGDVDPSLTCSGYTAPHSPWPHLPHFNAQLGFFDGCHLSSFNPASLVCSPDAEEPRLRCPESCAAEPPSPLNAPRVRKAHHRLTHEEWDRVVDPHVDKQGPFGPRQPGLQAAA